MVALLNPYADPASTDLVVPYFCAMDVVLALWTGLGLMVAGCLAAKIRMQPPPGTVLRS
jgi:hypothetical protein